MKETKRKEIYIGEIFITGLDRLMDEEIRAAQKELDKTRKTIELQHKGEKVLTVGDMYQIVKAEAEARKKYCERVWAIADAASRYIEKAQELGNGNRITFRDIREGA